MPSPILVRKLRYSQLDPSTIEYRNRIIVASSSISNASIKAIDAFVKGCKQDGIWDLLLEIYPFTGANLAAARVKLKEIGSKADALTNNGYTSGDYTESTGVQGADNKYWLTDVSSNNVGSTGGLSFYVREATAGGTTRFYIAAQNAVASPTQAFGLGYATAGTQSYFKWGQTGSNSGAATTESHVAGFYTGIIAAANNQILYRNGTQIATNTNTYTVTTDNFNFAIGAINNANINCTNFLNVKYSFGCIHRVLNSIQVALLYSRVQSLQQGLNRQV